MLAGFEKQERLLNASQENVRTHGTNFLQHLKNVFADNFLIFLNDIVLCSEAVSRTGFQQIFSLRTFLRDSLLIV